MRLWSLLLVVTWACAGAPEPPPPHQKPRAPVTVALHARPVGGGVFEITLEGRALAELDSLRLELALPAGARLASGVRTTRGERTARGAARRLVARVRADAGSEIYGVAHTPVGPEIATVRLGGAVDALRIAPAERVVVTPFGPVAEAR